MNSLGPIKAFRRKLLVENKLRFPEHIAYEDLPFTLEAYLKADNISVIADQMYYKYTRKEDGTSLSGEIPIFRTCSASRFPRQSSP